MERVQHRHEPLLGQYPRWIPSSMSSKLQCSLYILITMLPRWKVVREAMPGSRRYSKAQIGYLIKGFFGISICEGRPIDSWSSSLFEHVVLPLNLKNSV